tara:strand:+ start:157 stop:1692 length:1536 start_codon:yes stop_codon:yes gene_type:complete
LKKIIELSADDAREFFLKDSSYFNVDLPSYISFETILRDVHTILEDKEIAGFYNGKKKPNNYSKVNYSLISSKDGRFSWRPFELIHPAIYVSLVVLVCKEKNWKFIQTEIKKKSEGVVNCYSWPIVSSGKETDKAEQIHTWWKEIEQQSIKLSLNFSHLIHTDITDCYGSIYTHSIAWALHGRCTMKNNKRTKSLLGNQIDELIMACRYGQTNGIPQGSTLMDFIAELLLGFVDIEITNDLKNDETLKVDIDFKILRYRDDYRIFANSLSMAEKILKIISDALRSVGMKLGEAKTLVASNVVQGAIKPDKRAAIELQDLGTMHAKTVQKQLLRLHAFGLSHPNSGALKVLLSNFNKDIAKNVIQPDDVEVLVAILTDIGKTSPHTFPAIASILSHLIHHATKKEKHRLWHLVYNKMRLVPYNGYLEIWLQRVTIPSTLEFSQINHQSDETICKIVKGDDISLWENDWIGNDKLKHALNAKKIIISTPNCSSEKVALSEIALFKNNAFSHSG